jgi:hypothetical protein
MFDRDRYWQKKQEQERLKASASPFNFKSFFNEFFAREEIPTRKGHTRSAKVRRMRRQKHAAMMRNHA